MTDRLIRFACSVLLLLSLLFASSARAEVTVVVSPFPPTQEAQPGATMILQAQGVEEGQKITWHRIPLLDTDLVLGFDAGRTQLFVGTVPGPRTFLLQVEAPGLDPIIRADFEYGDVKPPEPPDPPDPPVPPPPGPAKKLLVLVVEEKTGSRPYLPVTQSLELQRWMAANGHRLLHLDKDTKDSQGNVPTELARYGKNLPGVPWVVFGDDETHVVLWQGPPPKTTAEMLGLAKQHGVEK